MTTTERNPGVLLLTADRDATMSLSAEFARRGFAVHTAPDGVRGVEVLLDTLLSLDVVVADAELPGRNAAALLQLVRVAGGERELAVVIRGGPSPAEERRLLALGADAVIDPATGAEEIGAAAAEAILRRSAAAAPVAHPPRGAALAGRAPSGTIWPLALPPALA